MACISTAIDLCEKFDKMLRKYTICEFPTFWGLYASSEYPATNEKGARPRAEALTLTPRDRYYLKLNRRPADTLLVSSPSE